MIEATMAPSETGSSGAASSTTMSKRSRSSASRLRICWLASSSEGLGGVLPTGRTVSSPRFQGTMASSSTAVPVRTLVSPTDDSTPMYSATFGRRMSASMRQTDFPAWARVIARLQAVVVLPSDGSAEVMATILGGLSTSTYWRLVRIVRNASERCDCWFKATRGVVAASGSKPM